MYEKYHHRLRDRKAVKQVQIKPVVYLTGKDKRRAKREEIRKETPDHKSTLAYSRVMTAKANQF